MWPAALSARVSLVGVEHDSISIARGDTTGRSTWDTVDLEAEVAFLRLDLACRACYVSEQ
jgi:hypothetical protein